MSSTMWNRRALVGALFALTSAAHSDSFAQVHEPSAVGACAMSGAPSTRDLADGPHQALVPIERERLYAPMGMVFRPALAMDGDNAAIGGASVIDVLYGAAFLYSRNGTLWTLGTLRIDMLADVPGLSFGTSVAISGTTAILGAPLQLQETGGAFAAMGVTGNAWQMATLLLPTEAAPGDHAGKAVAVSGSKVVIGAPDWSAASGAAFAFEFEFGKWNARGMILPTDSIFDAHFGSSVALSGNNLIVGAYGASVGAEIGQGAAYVFEWDGMAWIEKKKLTASDGKAGDAFGQNVALSGDTAIVGAALHDINGAVDQGSAYVYVRDSGAWTEQAVLTAVDGQTNDKFGSQVSISKELAVVGAVDDVTGMQGATGSVHLYRRQGTQWIQESQWAGAPNTNLGAALIISDTTVLAYVTPNDLSETYVSVFDILGELGESCSVNRECLSGQCVTGRCCPSNCDDGNACTTDTCEAGVCVSKTIVCESDTCNDRHCDPKMGECKTTFKGTETSCSDGLACTLADHCVNGTCMGEPLVCPSIDACHIGVCDAQTGTCTIKIDAQNSMCVEVDLNLGVSCLSELQCASGHCVDGVCCDSACETGCYSCVVPNFIGKCALEPLGEDRRGICGDTHACSRTCSGKEVDVGMDPCVDANMATKCSFEGCFDATHSQAAVYCVDHDQPCPAPEVRDCGAYACDPIIGVCRTECSSVIDCAPGLACNPQGRCVVAPPVGSGEEVSCSVRRVGSSNGLAGAEFVAALAFLCCLRRRRITGLGLSAALVALLSGCSPDRDVVSLEIPATAQEERAGPMPTLFDVMEQAEVRPSQPKAGRLYGSSASISGDTAVVGAPRELVGTNARQGAAFVFALQSGGSWLERARLVADDGTSFAHFGTSVAVFGDTAVVGAPSVNAAYVFVRTESMNVAQWIQQAKLVASDSDGTDGFGTSVAIEGDTVIVGADRKIFMGAVKGGAYVFVRNGGLWSQQAILVDGGQTTDDLAGTSVAISGDTAIVGAPGHDNGIQSNIGCAYIYVRNGPMWSQQAFLQADDAGSFDVFGAAVAVSGDTALFGAPGASIQMVQKGAAYVYVRNATVWAPQEKLLGSDLDNAQFGAAVSLQGDTAWVGAPGDSEVFAALGASYVFTRLGVAWTFKQKVWPTSGQAGDHFGASVSLSNDLALVGAFAHDAEGLADVGTAFTFQGLSPATGMAGDPCTMNTQCLSFSCVDNACCGVKCQGNCNTCVGDTCTPKQNGVACDDHRTCTTATCQSGTCVGEPLVCPGDACHHAFCDPVADQCKQDKLAPGTPCNDANACTLTDSCDAEGKCVGTNPLACPSLDACHVGICLPSSGQCKIVVNSMNADCPGTDLGGACIVDTDCSSAHCVDGVCCDSACDAKCQSCVLPGSAGHCGTEPKGHDRRGSCGSLGTCISTCSGIDAASGKDPCMDSMGGAECGIAQCLDATHSLSAVYCAGPNQPCPPATLQDCGDYGCDIVYGTCRTQCTTVRDCLSGRVCDPTGHCVPAPPVASGEDSSCTCSVPGGDSGAQTELLWLLGALALCAHRRR